MKRKNIQKKKTQHLFKELNKITKYDRIKVIRETGLCSLYLTKEYIISLFICLFLHHILLFIYFF